MNAYELADEYEYTKKEHDAFMENPTYANRIAVLCKRDEFLQKLIRQQADRIAELEKQSEPYGWHCFEDDDDCLLVNGQNVNKPDGSWDKVIPLFTTPQDQADRIAELEKQSEPVAWVYETENVDGEPYLTDVSLKPLFGLVTRYGYKEIPLYTTPQTKPLSDEEIIGLVKDHFIGAMKLGIVLTNDNVLEFARAIEERHGIK